MYLKQSDLFWGLSHDVIQKIMDKTVKLEFQPGDTIFKADDQAAHFYVLIDGKVRMELQDSGRDVYSSTKTGEIFGWSALIDRSEYSATVVCEEPTKALRFDKDHVQKLLAQDSTCSAGFYKQLARALGDRLLKTYDLLE